VQTDIKMLEIVHSKEMTTVLLEKGSYTDDICILMILNIDDADDYDAHATNQFSCSLQLVNLKVYEWKTLRLYSVM
jgi:hypothetical protein